MSTSASVDEIAKPADASLGAIESNDLIRLWLESTQVLSSDFNGLDASGAGTYNNNGDLNGGSIASGTNVSSYMLHFDTVGSQSHNYSGSVTFKQRILGVIVLDNSLNGSDATFGAGTTFYTGNNRGWESQESFTIEVGEYEISVSGQVSSPLDEYRVITEGVPEPATMSLLGFAAAAMVARKRRKKA